MSNFGFVRVAAATPIVRVADCDYNSEEIIKLTSIAEDKHVSIVVFPELSITGYTCGDLFQQRTLIDGAEQSIIKINEAIKNYNVTAIVGLPILVDGKLYNAAAVLSKGKVKAIVPKTYLPNYGEFQEARWFASSNDLNTDKIIFAGQETTINSNLIFETTSSKFGIELCEDLWTAIPPSSLLALNGAEIIFNLSASNEVVSKATYRRNLVSQQSGRCLSGYVYASAGTGESTTDTVFSGHSIIAENGKILAESERFANESNLTIADIDIETLQGSRMTNTSFTNIFHNFELKKGYQTIQIETSDQPLETLERKLAQTPFVPTDERILDERCQDVFAIQTAGLSKRLQHINSQTVVIGVSGGLDSTLALLVIVNTFDQLHIPRKNIYGITMPGFGTTDRTYQNALDLMKVLGITSIEIPIKKSVLQHFEDIDHDPNVHDITYENSQARERTQILMDYANKVNGLVIGTGDLSELALGWCTYNGDHMSMYAVNSSIPKTLVRTLVEWVATNKAEKESKRILLDIVETPVSPELLPADENGNITQKTEDTVGPYILHDFFLYYVVHSGFTPSKIYFLAQHAFNRMFENEIILKWLRTFYWRFFSQQFKRSCLPDGTKVGSISLSPRGDWRMPSDASVALWMREIEQLKP